MISLAVLAGLVTLVGALAATSMSASQGEWNRMRGRRAHLMVESGIQQAMSVLQKQDASKVTKSDDWAKLGDGGSTAYTLDRDGFRIQIIDGNSCFDLNSADQDLLKGIGLTSSQIDSILDWREDKVAPARPEGAKDEYYGLLRNGYNAKLKPFESTDELLQVKGFSPETLFGMSEKLGQPLIEALTTDSKSADKDPSGKDKLDANSATADQLVAVGMPQGLAASVAQKQNGSYKKLGDVLKVPQMSAQGARIVLDYLTIGTDKEHKGLINVNTASAATLGALPGMTSDVADAIVSRQSAGIKSLGELLDVPGIDLGKLAGVVDRLCVGSRSFVVRVIGSAGNMQDAAEASLELAEDGKVKITNWRPENPAMARARWRWDELPTGQVPVGGSS